jgi:radical SAM protein with 4Fe4S-binding SPASM domain
MGIETIAFSGGEPLLWEYIREAIEKAASTGIKVYVYTTGNVPNFEKTIQQLSEAGLSKIMFSIFGTNAEQHEKVTKSYGSYNKTITAAGYCVAIGLQTEFHFVPMKHNYRALPEILSKARNMGIDRVSILRLVPQGRGASTKHEELSHDQNRELRGLIKELRSDDYDIRLGSPYNFLMLNKKPQCCAGIDRITIGPDLRIFPCDAFKHITPDDIGASSDYSSLRDHSLAECWENSSYLGAVRKYLMSDFASECSACKKLVDCRSGCMSQKFYACGELKKTADPMCLLKKEGRC